MKIGDRVEAIEDWFDAYLGNGYHSYRKGWTPSKSPIATSKEIHDKLYVLYSQYNDLGEALLQIDDMDNPWAYELIQSRYNVLAQEIESISKKEWREA
jgi:hypothetical protein